MLTRNDILSALGAEVHEDNFLSGMLIGIGVGAVVGGAVAMLFAPRTGNEMRQIISERVPDLIEKAKTKIGVGNGNKEGSSSKEMSGEGTTR